MPNKKRLITTWLGFWIVTMLLYRHGYGNQFIDDYIAGIVRFMDEGWAGFADSYDFPSLYYGHNIVFYGFYSVFGSSALAWFLLFTGLHSLNAAFGYGFIKRLFTNNGFQASTAGALVAALLFLVSPYQTENVIWGATLHYAVSMLCMWGIMWLYAGYLDSGKAWMLWLSYLMFAFSLLTLEISLVFPGIFMIVFGLLWRPVAGLKGLFSHFKPIALPMGLLIGLYLIGTYWLKGHFIGHYGSDTHLKFSAVQLLGSLWQYLAKLLGFVHYYPFHIKEFIYLNLVKATVAFGLLAVAIGIWVVLWKYRKPLAWFALGWMGLVFIALLPVLNMYFMFLNQGENDRLSYLASVFIYAIPVLLLMWFARRLVWAYGAVVLVVSVFFLNTQTTKWQHAATLQAQAADSPLFYGTKGNIYLLNLPCYYQGVYVYRRFHRLHWARQFYGLPDLSNQLQYVVSANMQLPTDSVIAVALPEPNTFKVELSTWGNWFWYHMNGAQNRTEEEMTITLDEWGHSYTLYLPNLKPEDRLLYFTHNGWQAVKYP